MKPMKPVWLDRSLLQGPRVALVTSDKQFLAAKRSAGVECNDPMLERGWHACVHAYTDARGELICIVGLDLNVCAQMSGVDVAALLAHEAVHVWQRVRDRFGPTAELGREMEAYAVQNIVGNLMAAYVRAAGVATSWASSGARPSSS